MSNFTAKRLLEITIAELGYQEKETNSQLDSKTANAGDGNYTKYARDLRNAGYYNGNKNGFAWCDMFVDWCFYQLCDQDAAKAQEVQCQTGPYGAGCYWSAKYYKQQNRFYTSDPHIGDQVFFGRNGEYEHTGIVEFVKDGMLHTIEGNTSNKVARRTYKLTSTYILGYGRPKYDLEPVAPATPTNKSVEEVAKEVIRGKWSNGAERRILLTNAGYNYAEVQARVTELLKGATPAKKSVDEVASECIKGLWGNGDEREQRLTAAGYDYATVQKRVNQLLKQ